jgi:hypothetical protein
MKTKWLGIVISSIILLLVFSLAGCTCTPSPTPEPASTPTSTPTPAPTPVSTPSPSVTDKPNLSEDEVCAYLWSRLSKILPPEYKTNQFDSDTREATYDGNGKWTFVVFGSGEDTVELPVKTYEKDKDEFSEFHTDSHGIEHFSSWVEEHSRTVTTYKLKLSAQYYETTALAELTDIDKFDVQSETLKEEIPIPDPERKGLRLNWITGQYDGNWLTTQGSVTNIGQVPLENATIEISVYDLEGNFVRADNATLSPSKIGLDENANFHLRLRQWSEGGTFSYKFFSSSGEEIFCKKKGE